MPHGYRFAPGRSEESAKERLEELIAGRASYTITDMSPSGAVCLHEPLLQRFIQLNDPVIRPKQAWTDVARLTTAGIPAVNFGPGVSAQAHQAGEWTEEILILECYQMLERFLTDPDAEV